MFQYDGEMSKNQGDAFGFGKAKCVDDPEITFTGYFESNKPRYFCKKFKVIYNLFNSLIGVEVTQDARYEGEYDFKQ